MRIVKEDIIQEMQFTCWDLNKDYIHDAKNMYSFEPHLIMEVTKYRSMGYNLATYMRGVTQVEHTTLLNAAVEYNESQKDNNLIVHDKLFPVDADIVTSDIDFDSDRIKGILHHVNILDTYMFSKNIKAKQSMEWIDSIISPLPKIKSLMIITNPSDADLKLIFDKIDEFSVSKKANLGICHLNADTKNKTASRYSLFMSEEAEEFAAFIRLKTE